MNNFRVGDKVKNIDRDSKRYGFIAEVTDTDGTYVEVEYSDGHVGSAKTGSKYYQIVPNSTRTTGVENKNTPMFETIYSAVKRAVMSEDNKALQDSGVMNSCGNVNDEVIKVLLQEWATSATNKPRLIEIANAILEDRAEKAKKNK